ncbi:MAG TPA: adenosine deaminase [Patescibacteria group bacterium]|nr:adenosine deaminase [Patescibacteria group bacterium]
MARPSLPAVPVRAWPKAELHLHLEGSMRPDTVLALAARHGVSVSREEVHARYSYKDFDGFIQSYIWVTSLLRQPEDYAFIAQRLFEDLHGQNVIYAEITLSVGVMLWREQDPSAIFAALRRAAEEAGRAGLSLQWVFDVVRQFGPEKAMDVARIAVRHRGEGVVAFGMGGDELAVPAAQFRAVYDHARDHGLHSLVHAGEVGAADEVRRAIELLGAERIGHGIAAIQDPEVMQLLTGRGIPLEVCPTSNLRTGALGKVCGDAKAGLAEHPVADLYFAGVPITLSTDDPGMFETSLNEEYAAAEMAGLGIADLVRVNEQGFSSAFLPETEKSRLLARFHKLLESQGLLY